MKNEITYLHGFRSFFDLNKPKVQTLSKLGPVDGPQIDYENDSLSEIEEKVCDVRPVGDVLIGTSMGGWLAAHCGIKYGIPFVAINPVTNPQIQAVGRHIRDVHDYPSFPIEGSRCGLILLDEGDDVLDSLSTFDMLKVAYHVEMFPGGSHRFDHAEESVVLINNFIEYETILYGLQ